MKIARFTNDGIPRIAINAGNGWIAYDLLLAARGIDIPSADSVDPDRLLVYLLKCGLLENAAIHEHLKWANQTVKTFAFTGDTARPLLPLRPGKLVCVARNYIEHAKETGHNLPPHPIFFGKTDNCPIGPFEPIQYHQGFGRIDHEGELAVVIGRTASNVTTEKAMNFIFGYTIVNDITAREHQKYLGDNHWPWYVAKSLDGFAPIGPWIVTPDEMGSLSDKGVRVTVNGELRQNGRFSDMAWKVPALIAEITKGITLNPGDIIATGTPSGIGPILPGDIVTVEIEGIGSLINPVE